MNPWSGTPAYQRAWRRVDAGRLGRGDLTPPTARAFTDDDCLLSSQSGLPTGRLGEAVMAYGISVIADVVDPARA